SAGSDYTSMGKLTFDESKFPEPRGHFANYKRKGIGLIPIEESYIGKALPEHKNMSQQGFLAHECGRPTVASYLTGQTTGNTSEWWGRGGMIDWSNKAAGAYWHDNKRRNLANLGVIGHWLDLGEPEMFDAASCYAGSGEPGKDRHQDVHNVFSLLWAESLYDGYTRNKDKQRPYSILRSGNVGIQRYGAGMWSGDIGGNLESLSAHLSSHNQMSWSGIDYYSSDI
ncbi:MAG: glycoside hydrolase family 31, partial [Proteobacteria bacterium]|nr:glycoside hydrolase family 31 [Pseudomonadota bacterium]